MSFLNVVKRSLCFCMLGTHQNLLSKYTSWAINTGFHSLLNLVWGCVGFDNLVLPLESISVLCFVTLLQFLELTHAWNLWIMWVILIKDYRYTSKITSMNFLVKLVCWLRRIRCSAVRFGLLFSAPMLLFSDSKSAMTIVLLYLISMQESIKSVTLELLTGSLNVFVGGFHEFIEFPLMI